MSPASYLTAPPRVAARIVAPSLRSPDVGLGRLGRSDRRGGGRGGRARLRRRARAAGLAGLQARAPAPLPRARHAPHDGRAPGRERRRRDGHTRAAGQRRAASPLARAARGAARGGRRGARHRRPLHRGHAAQVIVAAIDLGTNTTRLLVADVEEGELRELRRETKITRLGEGVDTRGRLLPVPIARVRNVLSDYRRAAEELGAERTLLVATSAVRDAENGEAFLGEIEWSYGFATRLLSGEEEAELMRRGIGAVEPGTLLVDIGGGSTELVLDDFDVSLAMGSVRFTERHGEDVAALEIAARKLLPEIEPSAAVGVAGTITTLAALDLRLPAYDRKLVHGHLLTREAARAQLDRLAALPLEERRRVPALEPERAPVIVAGAAILAAILDRYGLDGITVSERGLLHGAALAAAELPEPEEGAAPPGAYTCC